MTLPLLKLLLVTPLLCVMAWKDMKTHILPNALTIGCALFAAAVAFIAEGTGYMLYSILSGFICAIFLLIPFFLRAAGAGDVKMLFAAGIAAGPGGALPLMLLVSLCGIVTAVVALMMKKVDTRRLKHVLQCLFNPKYDRALGKSGLPPRTDEASRVPFGVAIAAGLFLLLMLQAVGEARLA
ncbi:MAG: prepilin peptidase [Victivallaceae bacterium]|nr:prepilin peptidase [Victivallaceae bacterium]